MPGPEPRFVIPVQASITETTGAYIRALQSAHQISQSEAIRRVLDYAAERRLFLPVVSTDSTAPADGSE